MFKMIRGSMIALLAFAAGSAVAAEKYDVNNRTFPNLQCDRYGCTVVRSTDARIGSGRPQAPNAMGMSTIGAPAGQRFFWSKDDFPACVKNFAGASYGSPYVYMAVDELPVPLGSQHASLSTTFQLGMAGGPGGASSAVGMLQIRRSGGTWVNADASYQLTAMGAPHATYFPTYGRGTLMGVEDLAQLPGGSGVPSLIDVRVVLFTVVSTGYDVEYEQDACYGNLSVTF